MILTETSRLFSWLGRESKSRDNLSLLLTRLNLACEFKMKIALKPTCGTFLLEAARALCFSQSLEKYLSFFESAPFNLEGPIQFLTLTKGSDRCAALAAIVLAGAFNRDFGSFKEWKSMLNTLMMVAEREKDNGNVWPDNFEDALREVQERGTGAIGLLRLYSKYSGEATSLLQYMQVSPTVALRLKNNLRERDRVFFYALDTIREYENPQVAKQRVEEACTYLSIERINPNLEYQFFVDHLEKIPSFYDDAVFPSLIVAGMKGYYFSGWWDGYLRLLWKVIESLSLEKRNEIRVVFPDLFEFEFRIALG